MSLVTERWRVCKACGQRESGLEHGVAGFLFKGKHAFVFDHWDYNINGHALDVWLDANAPETDDDKKFSNKLRMALLKW